MAARLHVDVHAFVQKQVRAHLHDDAYALIRDDVLHHCCHSHGWCAQHLSCHVHDLLIRDPVDHLCWIHRMDHGHDGYDYDHHDDVCVLVVHLPLDHSLFLVVGQVLDVVHVQARAVAALEDSIMLPLLQVHSYLCADHVVDAHDDFHSAL